MLIQKNFNRGTNLVLFITLNVTEVAGLKAEKYQNTLNFIKMKKLNLLTKIRYCGYILLVAGLISCSEKDRSDLIKSLDNSRCIEAVEKAYPKAKVYPLPDIKYRYIVIDTCGKVMYVRVLGKWDEISIMNVIQDCR